MAATDSRHLTKSKPSVILDFATPIGWCVSFHSPFIVKFLGKIQIMVKTLGRLEPVELREAWETEDRDFTPWLAQEEHLQILADAIGMELVLEAQEKDVGPFRADILCKNINDDSWVLVENQIEKTDHRHLGQTITYASGLQAVTIVWIASKFTEEHRAALDWLNNITDDHFRFFGLELELWRIDDSPPAPNST